MLRFVFFLGWLICQVQIAESRYQTGPEEVIFAGTVVDVSRPLASHSWDHTEALRRQQEEAAMRASMASAVGGMSAALPETAAVQLTFSGGGTTVSGFTPSSGSSWQSIADPMRREMMRRSELSARYPGLSRRQQEGLCCTNGFLRRNVV